MAITQPTIDDFSDTTVMRVIRKVVNYLVTLIPKVNEEIANVTDSAGERLDTVEANVEALNKELPTEIRVDYDASTGNFNIDYVKEDGDVLTSNTVVIVSGSTGEVTIVQNTSGISINGTALQSATTTQPGLMTPALVASLDNVNDTVNDHTTMINEQAEALTELDGRVDALEQAGGSSGGSNFISINGYKTQYEPLLETTFICKGITQFTSYNYGRYTVNSVNAKRTEQLEGGVAYIRDANATESIYESETSITTCTGMIEAFVNGVSKFIKINGNFTGSIVVRPIPYAVSTPGQSTLYNQFYYDTDYGNPQISLNYVNSVLESFNSATNFGSSAEDSEYLVTRGDVLTVTWYFEVLGGISGSFA